MRPVSQTEYWIATQADALPTTDNLIYPKGAGNFPDLCLCFNFIILSINPFPIHNQAASTANQPAVEEREANDFDGV